MIMQMPNSDSNERCKTRGERSRMSTLQEVQLRIVLRQIIQTPDLPDKFTSAHRNLGA